MSRRAFTLVELLVVIAIVGLLSTIAVVSLGVSRTKGKAARVLGDLRQINTALQMYVDTNGGYPCFDHDFSDTWETTWSAPYIKWPKPPYGGHYHFEYGGFGAFSNPAVRYTISIENVPTAADGQALSVVAPGQFQGTSGRVEWFGVDQNVPVPVPQACP